MELKDINGIGPAKQQKLKDAGIGSVEELAKADIPALAQATGMTEASLREFQGRAKGMALLNDLKGMNVETVRTLAMSGIASLKDLYEASTERIAAEAKVAREKAEKWQAEARALAERVKTEAKTPEGRAKLRGEAVDLAETTLKRSRELAVEIYERTRREGETAIQKAKEIQEKAPAAIKEYREKAEAALREAESRVRELQEKAPQQAKEIGARAQAALDDAQHRVQELRNKIEEVTRSEVEKFKAANEGFLGRLRSRFSRRA